MIIENGSYFKKDYDEKTNTVRLDNDAKDWYMSQMGIKSSDETFMKFYNLVGTPPLGNGIQLLAMDEIFEDEHIKDEFIIIGDDELGMLLYIKATGEINQYEFQNDSIESLDDLKNKIKSWDNFKLFIHEYYEIGKEN